ncbi:MAG TPA: hypothetical protein VF434_11580 [Promineifilum sp.]
MQDHPAAPERLSTLHRQIVEQFNLEELRDLCLYLGIRWESLSGDTIEAKATSLLTLLNNNLRLDSLFQELETQRPGFAWQLSDILEPPAPPYRGLEYYREQDAVIFFGRAGLTQHLVERLAGSPVLAIVGASGSGKSSAVRAGVIPALKNHSLLSLSSRAPPGSIDWEYLTITPGVEPFERLAVAVTNDLVQVEQTLSLAGTMATDPSTIKIAIEKFLLRRQRSRLCLFIDQFEELFNTTIPEARRQAFIDGLLAAAVPDGSLVLILCLRADYYHHCEPYQALRTALEQNQTYIGAIGPEELREVISRPAERRGYELEPGLADLILRDVGEGPGRLPLLSHALHETWLRRNGARMTLGGYQAAGGVDRAIATTAGDLYAKLTPEQQAITRHIFLELIQVNENAPETSRAIDRLPLLALADPREVERIVEALIAARLVVRDYETIQIAHEALIQNWPQLRVWLEEDREKLIFRHRLEAAAVLWQDSECDPDYLYSGRQLAQASERHIEYGLPPDKAIDVFLQACKVAERRRKRVAGLGVLLTMLAGAGAMAVSGYLLQTVWLGTSPALAIPLTIAFAILGTIVGLLYTQGFDWVLAWGGDTPAARWTLIVLFGFFLFGLTLYLLNLGTPDTGGALLFVTGGVWGVVAAVGRVWAKSRPPRILLVGAAGGLALAGAYLIVSTVFGGGLGPDYPQAPPWTLFGFVAGAFIPFAVLSAEWTGITLGRRSQQ